MVESEQETDDREIEDAPESRSARNLARQLRRDATRWADTLLRAQQADVEALIAGVADYHAAITTDTTDSRAQAETMGSHLRALSQAIELREMAICSALRLREQAVIAGSADATTRAQAATILGKLVPRPISLPGVELPSTGKGDKPGMG